VDAKHRIVQLLGITGLLSGSFFGLLVLRGLILRRVADAWGAMDLIFAFAFAAYLLSVGIRAMRWARGQGTAASMKIKWEESCLAPC